MKTGTITSATKGRARGRGDWASRPAACDFLGCSPDTLDRLIEGGQLTVRTLPGSQPRVYWPSVVALAEQHTRGPLVQKQA
jgi:hypothetical protein